MAGHSAAGSSTTQTQSNQIQTSVIKTMILVSTFYAAAWLPINVFYVYFMVNPNASFISTQYYVAVFLSFFYTCANPFIYVMKFDPVKKVLRNIIFCKKTPNQQAVAGGT